MKSATPPAQKSFNWLRILLVLLAALAPVTYLVMLFLYAVNVPFWDDYDAILGNLAWLEVLPTFGKKMEWVFLMHGNEHLTGLLQSFAWIDYKLFGGVSFSHMIWVGNACLLLFAFVVLRDNHRKGIEWLFVLPFLPLLFHQHYFEATYWGTVALQLFPATLLAWLTLAQLLKNTWKGLIWSCLLLAATLQAFGSGLILLVLMLFILVLWKRWRHLLAMLPVMALLLLMFFVRFPELPHQGSRVDAVFVYPLRTLHFLFTVAGSGLPINRDYYWIGGVALLLPWLVATIRRFWRINALLYFFLLFIWMVVGSGALSRAGGGIAEAFAPRYAFYGSLIQALSWIVIAQLSPGKARMVVLALGMTLALAVAFLHQTADEPVVRREHERRVNSIVFCSASGDSILYQPSEIAFQKLGYALEHGHYKAPHFDGHTHLPTAMAALPAPDGFCSISFADTANLVFTAVVMGKLNLPPMAEMPEEAKVLLRKGERVLGVPAVLTNLSSDLEPNQQIQFRAAADREGLPSGFYDAGIWLKMPGGEEHVTWSRVPFLVNYTDRNLKSRADVTDKADAVEVHLVLERYDPQLGYPAAFLLDEEGRILPQKDGLPAKLLFPRQMECNAGGPATYFWLADASHPFPERNFSLAITVTPDPGVLIDSTAERASHPDRRGQRVCVDLFPETIGTNNLSLSVGANGYLLRHEHEGQLQVLASRWMQVSPGSVFVIVVEDNKPSLFLNGELQFKASTPLPGTLVACPNIGRVSSDGFAGWLGNIKVWDHATYPSQGQSAPDDKEGIINALQWAGPLPLVAQSDADPAKRSGIFNRLEMLEWIGKPAMPGHYGLAVGLVSPSGTFRKWMTPIHFFEVPAPDSLQGVTSQPALLH